MATTYRQSSETRTQHGRAQVVIKREESSATTMNPFMLVLVATSIAGAIIALNAVSHWFAPIFLLAACIAVLNDRAELCRQMSDAAAAQGEDGSSYDAARREALDRASDWRAEGA